MRSRFVELAEMISSELIRMSIDSERVILQSHQFQKPSSDGTKNGKFFRDEPSNDCDLGDFDPYAEEIEEDDDDYENDDADEDKKYKNTAPY